VPLFALQRIAVQARRIGMKITVTTNMMQRVMCGDKLFQAVSDDRGSA
jgi:hypothetical protein